MDKGILSLLGLNCVATWSERSRCENILTLGINDGPPPGPTKLRPDFPRAVRTVAAIQHEEGWMNSYIPKHFRERQRRIDDKGRLDFEWQSWNPNVKKNNGSQASSSSSTKLVAVKRMVLATRTGMARTARMARMAPTSTVSPSHQPFCQILAHSQFFQGVSLTGTSGSLVSDGECEQNTSPRACNT